QTQLQTMVSGALGENSELSYGVTANHAWGGDTSSTTGGSANALYRSPYAQFSGTVGAGTGYSQGSLGVSGAVVAHPGGVTLSQPLSDTFGIIEAPNAEGAHVTNASGAQVDSRGYAVIPYLTPYSMNTVELDPKGLSTDVELQETSQQVAPHAGAIALLKFATVYGRSAVIEVRQANGTPLPFGATVQDDSGKDVGVVGQASRIFARGLQDKGNLTVKWGEDSGSLCHLSYDLPVRKKDSQSDSYQQIEATCSAAAASTAAPSYKPNVAAASSAAK
ncbi:fimbrial biogenesis outer membrane usher protein, partial [Paraburkholderia aspalathi]|uniref:fimbria/pilus outer membrane usher protein n=1 Tax=Paraburkholderia nemoris TaxID=2793076 RepID=UPI00190B2AFA